MTTRGFKLTDKQAELRGLLNGPAKHCLLYGGSRSGKTFLLCYAALVRAIKAPGSRHLILRRHAVTARQSIGNDTMPKVRQLAFPGVAWKWKEQDGYWTLWNGSEIWIGGLDDKERVDKILGREYATIYFNEASEIPYASYEVAQTRLAQKVDQSDGVPLSLRSYVDLNPTTRDHWTHKLWIEGVTPDKRPVDAARYAYGVANPGDNAENLPPGYIDSLAGLSERQRRRFLDGEYSGDDDNALWRRAMIRYAKPPQLSRVVVAVDPAVSNTPGSDETGLIVVGRSEDGQAYVLADDSGRWRPEEWARRAVALYRQYDADRIVAEVNQGGDMVEATIRAQTPNMPFTAVHATRGKVVRAEPVSALYERGKVHHAEEFPELESQMCAFTIDFDRRAQGWSPDRVDALVWGVMHLFPDMTRQAPKVDWTEQFKSPAGGAHSWMAS